MKSYQEFVSEKSTSQLQGNLLSLMADDKNFKEIKKSMVIAITGSPFFIGKSKLIRDQILKDIDKSKHVKDFEKVSKKYKLESLLVT